MEQCNMKYVGYIHRLYIMLEKENLTEDQIIDKIYEIMQNDESIEEITKIEIKQVIESRIKYEDKVY